jgi:hypothetical protein
VWFDADSTNTTRSFVVDWEVGLPPMSRPNRVFLGMILGGEWALGVVTLDVVIMTCLGIGGYDGVIRAKGGSSEMFVVRDLSDAAICELSG